jgi:hypothetical protein
MSKGDATYEEPRSPAFKRNRGFARCFGSKDGLKMACHFHLDSQFDLLLNDLRSEPNLVYLVDNIFLAHLFGIE